MGCYASQRWVQAQTPGQVLEVYLHLPPLSQSLGPVCLWVPQGASRRTYLKSQHTVMGPISDARGVEKGGIAASKLFQLIMDGELKTLNSTDLGLPIGDVNLAVPSLADDLVLLSTSMTRT